MAAPNNTSNAKTTLRVKKVNTAITPEDGDPLQLFELIEKVGQGSYGEIYKAIARKGHQVVALKIIDLEKTEDDIEDLLAEVDFQAKCDSPYLAKYLGSWMFDMKLTIAMEYLGGGTLEEMVKECELTEDQCGFILREVLRGMYYMHKGLKIHRDIKPANILFDNVGSLKLADFGVAAQMTNSKKNRSTFVGTPLYLAPEIVLSLPYDEKVDIWSLGIMAIEIATGKAPKCEQHPMDIIYKIPTTPSPILPEKFSNSYKDFVKKCLIKTPKKRLSAQELLKHPFIVAAENFDKSIIKKSLESYKLLKKRDKTAIITADQNDWWQQYSKATQAKAASASEAKGPSLEARASVRPEIAKLDPAQTYGKGKVKPIKGKNKVGPLLTNVHLSNVGDHPTADSLLNGKADLRPAANAILSANELAKKANAKKVVHSAIANKDSKKELNAEIRTVSLKTDLNGSALNKGNNLSRPNSTGNLLRNTSNPKLNTINGSGRLGSRTNLLASSRSGSAAELLKLGSQQKSFPRQFREILSPYLKTCEIRPTSLTLMKIAAELYVTECQFVEVFERFIELYVRPLMGSNSATNTILKEDQIKASFANPTKILSTSLLILDTFKDAIGMITSDADIDNAILTAVEAIASEIESSYTIYAGALCKNLWESQKYIQTCSKFREFLMRQQASEKKKGMSFFDFLCYPDSRLKMYGKIFKDSLKLTSNARMTNVSRNMVELFEDLQDSMQNVSNLLKMLVTISDLPPAIILKPKQIYVTGGEVEKLNASVNNITGLTIKNKKVAKIYLLKDAIIMVRVGKDYEDIQFNISELFDPVKLFKIKQSLQYRHLYSVEFADCIGLPDKEDSKNIFGISLRFGIKKYHFAATKNPELKEQFIEALRSD